MTHQPQHMHTRRGPSCTTKVLALLAFAFIVGLLIPPGVHVPLWLGIAVGVIAFVASVLALGGE